MPFSPSPRKRSSTAPMRSVRKKKLVIDKRPARRLYLRKQEMAEEKKREKAKLRQFSTNLFQREAGILKPQEDEYDSDEERRKKRREHVSLEDLKKRIQGKKGKKSTVRKEPLFPGYFDSTSQLPPKRLLKPLKEPSAPVRAGRIFDPIQTMQEETMGYDEPAFPPTPKTPSKRLQKMFSPRQSLQKEDDFVEEIVGIERRLKSRKSSRRRKKRKQSLPNDPDSEMTEARRRSVLSQGSAMTEFDFDVDRPQSQSKRKKDVPVLFQSVDTQKPLKLQYDPSQLQGFGNTLRDYKMMAEACNRGGKNRMEGLAHYKLATIYEDKHKPGKAIRHYRKFLYICQGLKDEVGTSLSLNRLGVLFQTLGGKENLKTALEYHIRHWEIADTQSKIVAHINMGLIFQHGSKDLENAAEHYRMAFQYALEIGDKHGESIALSNLGTLGKVQGDLATAEVCIERHLQLSENMRDNKSTTDAYQQLGMLSIENGQEDQALDMLHKARQTAHIHNDQLKANQIKCSIGILKGSVQADQFIKEIGEQLRAKYSYT